MEYTIQKLGRLAGVSTRTLRYYDELGILTPRRVNSSGYRIYGEQEVSRLQQILFYRELGVRLDVIKHILQAPGYDAKKALHEHHMLLLERRGQLDTLITNVEKTIAESEGRITMKDKERFEGFKKKLISDNEKSYGTEIREKYGDDAVNKSNAKLAGMTEQQYNEAQKLHEDIIAALLEAFETQDAGGEQAQKAADMHRRWLCLYWDTYTPEAHAGLGQMYVEDERFKVNYDQHQPGLAAFFRDAIHIYTKTM